VHQTPGRCGERSRGARTSPPIWFDEPTGVIMQDGLAKIVEESVMPTGLGHSRAERLTMFGRHLM
jgi:hypothetical protein